MKTLGIISASKCNLKCEYCYLHKNKSYINEDKKTLQAILDGSFIKNVKRTLKKLSIDREDFGKLELWGGETTLIFLLFTTILLSPFSLLTTDFSSDFGTLLTGLSSISPLSLFLLSDGELP